MSDTAIERRIRKREREADFFNHNFAIKVVNEVPSNSYKEGNLEKQRQLLRKFERLVFLHSNSGEPLSHHNINISNKQLLLFHSDSKYCTTSHSTN